MNNIAKRKITIGTNQYKLLDPSTKGTASIMPHQAFLEFVRIIAKQIATKKIIEIVLVYLFLVFSIFKAIVNGQIKENHDPA